MLIFRYFPGFTGMAGRYALIGFYIIPRRLYLLNDLVLFVFCSRIKTVLEAIETYTT